MLRQSEKQNQKTFTCPLCAHKGEAYLNNLSDMLFGVAGTWDSSRCLNPECGLVWIDPLPQENEIPTFYKQYLTHINKKNSLGRTLPPFLRGFGTFVYQLYSKWSTLSNDILHDEFFSQKQSPPGDLLEIGCGSGHVLKRFKDHGWKVIGQDFDSKAAEACDFNYGIKVEVGNIHTLDFDNKKFDLIIMNHVLEHLLSPLEMINRAYSLLKPKGRLIIVTPNLLSSSSKAYGPFWSGMDVPRHVQLYKQESIAYLFKKSLFKNNFQVHSSEKNGWSFCFSSYNLKRKKEILDNNLFLNKIKKCLAYMGFYTIWQHKKHQKELQQNPFAGTELVVCSEKH